MTYSVVAANAPMIIGSDVTGSVGETVDVTISLKDNPGLVSMTLTITYDSDKLELVSVTDSGILPGKTHKPELETPYTLVWANDTATENIMIEGAIVTLSFKILNAAVVGESYPVGIFYDLNNWDIYNCNTEVVEFDIKCGSVNIVCSHTDSDGEWESDEVYHFRTCACGHTFDRLSHSGGTATCHEKAKCEICESEYGTVNKDNHTGGTELINVSAADHKAQIPGYSGDTKCLGCGEIIAYGQSVEPGTHIPSNNWSCSDTHHWKICGIEGCGVVIDGSEAAHESTGSNKANCKEQGVCDVCADVFAPIDPTNHVNCTETDTEPPSCSDVGYTSGVWCDDCETYVTGHEEIPATGEHTDADGEWESDEVYHFRTCFCGHTFDSFSHSGGTATCHEKAKCEVCGSEHGTVNKNNHTGGTLIVNFSAPDHKNQIIGNTGDTKCLGCGEIITYGAPIIPGAHIPSGGWSMDRTHHWKVCGIDGCGAVIEETKEQHSFGDDGTCSACGIKHNTVTSFNSDTYPVTIRLLDALGNEVYYQGLLSG